MAMRPWLLFRYGRLLTRFKRKDRALQVFQAVIRAHPRHADAWSCAGFLLAERGDLEAAIDAFRHAIAIDERHAPSHFNIGYLLQRLDRHDEAAAHLRLALEMDPHLERARQALDLSLAQLAK
ncbi:MAG TPA: tetratricopeptide repeat protein [Burkholderiales bacterium]|nr:tetratricopeptide repeat protein [Burkholderiales bacterium]